MEIINNNLNSLPQQVEENMENIKRLAKYLKDVYNTQTSLTTSSVSIAISDTNADSDTTTGWLIDVNGLLFHITNGDRTNLLLEYYASIKGATGATGATGAPGATGADGKDGTNAFYYSQQITSTTINETYIYNPLGETLKEGDIVFDKYYNIAIISSIVGGVITITLKVSSIIDDSLNANNKVWSGSKSLKNADKGIYYTTTAPTLDGGNYTLAVSDVANQNTEAPDIIIKVNDVVLYVDGDSKVKEMYVLTNVTASTLTMSKVAEVGGGKKLYQHCIYVKDTLVHLNAGICIINDSPTPIETKYDLAQWLYNNGFNSAQNVYALIYSGKRYVDNTNSWLWGIYSTDGSNTVGAFYQSLNSSADLSTGLFNDPNTTLKDIVIQLL